MFWLPVTNQRQGSVYFMTSREAQSLNAQFKHTVQGTSCKMEHMTKLMTELLHINV